MVTLIKYGALSGGVKYNINQMWICGLSTDTKPTTKIDNMGIPNGSVYTEVDTGKTYMFDYDNATWYEVSIGGGGGGTSGGIVLVGETTTALTDNATTNPITINGSSYTAQPNDAVIYGNKEFLFDGTKWHEFGDLSGLSSKDIGAMTNYVIAQTGAAINTSDTLNQAIGKVEKRVEVNETNISLVLAPRELPVSMAYDGYYLNSSGDIVSSSVWNVTNYIKLNSKSTYQYNGLTNVGNAPVSCFYDDNYNFVGYFKQAIGKNQLEVPTGATQVRFSVNSSDINSFTIEEQPQYGLSDLATKIEKSDNEMSKALSHKISILNIREDNIDNCAWSWWTSPQIVYDDFARNKYYFGHVSSNGIAGVAGFSAVDITQKRTKTHIRNVGADDHNGMAIYKNKSGSVSSMYLGFVFGHNAENKMHIYISAQADNADLYREPINIEFPDKIAYAQVNKDKIGTAYNESRLLLTTRVGNNNWYGVFSSTYFGNTWGEPQPIVKSDRQYYCIFKPVSDNDRILRIIMYSNPNITTPDTRIRMGFLDMSTGDIYNSNGTTKLGSMSTGGVNYTDFDVIIDVATGHRNRLLDVAISPKNEVYVSYASFTDETDAVYYVYYNGATVEVVSCGEPFYNPSVYVGGMIFDPTDKNTVYVSRKPTDDHISRIEKYTYSSGTYSLISELFRCATRYRYAIRPIITDDGKYIVFQHGTANVNNFEQYNYDAEIINLTT